jgi:hypothetical protein
VIAWITAEEISHDWCDVSTKFLITSYNTCVWVLSSLFCFRIFNQSFNVCFVNTIHCFLLVPISHLAVDFLLRAGRFLFLSGALILCLRAPPSGIEGRGILMDRLGASAGTRFILRNMFPFHPGREQNSKVASVGNTAVKSGSRNPPF